MRSLRDDLIEKVARAIAIGEYGSEGWKSEWPDLQDTYRSYARDAVTTVLGELARRWDSPTASSFHRLLEIERMKG